MDAKTLMRKTQPFIRAKLILGGAMIAVAAVALGLLMGIGWLFGDTGAVIGFLLWLGCLKVIRLVFMHYMGYLVKAGHIAVIAESCRTGTVPRNQVEYGKQKVKERFVTSNVYFAVDQLVSGAVRQIQKAIGKVGDFLDFIPGIEAVTGAAQFFVNIALGYVDECCFGWTFWNGEQDVYKSAADAVVIYAQNWKQLLKDAAKTLVKVLVLTVVLALVIFVPVGLVFRILKWNGLIAFVLACLIAWVVKFAYLDSFIMIRMMTSYLEAAPNTAITFDLYGKLSGISGDFKKLFDQADIPQPEPAYAGGMEVEALPVRPEGVCPTCGTQLTPGTKFCGVCGTKQ